MTVDLTLYSASDEMAMQRLLEVVVRVVAICRPIRRIMTTDSMTEEGIPFSPQVGERRRMMMHP